jgi:hypothetical protein
MPRLELASYALAFDFQAIADQDIRHALRRIVRALANGRRA